MAIETNDQGGKQEAISTAFHLLDPVVLKLLAQCRKYGADKYGDWNHLEIPASVHIGRAMAHLNSYQEKIRNNSRMSSGEQDLVHAFIRTMFAISCELKDHYHPTEYSHPEAGGWAEECPSFVKHGTEESKTIAHDRNMKPIAKGDMVKIFDYLNPTLPFALGTVVDVTREFSDVSNIEMVRVRIEDERQLTITRASHFMEKV